MEAVGAVSSGRNSEAVQERRNGSGKARGPACHAVHDQSFSEIKVIFINFHGQNVHKTKCYVL